NSGSVGFSNTATFTGLTAGANSDFQIVDINGDGLADLLYPQSGLSVRYLEIQGSGYGFSDTLIQIDLPGDPALIPEIIPPPEPIDFMLYRFYQDDNLNVIANDVNGDGVADLILRVDVYYLENPPRLNDPQPYRFISAGEELLPNGEPMQILDSSHWVAFIGNGLDNNNKLDYYSELYYIKKTSSLSDAASKDIKFIDINADGLTDVIAKNTTNNWQYKLSNGTGFNTFTDVDPISNEDQMQLFDYNLDGYIDIVYPLSVSGQPYYAKRWTGNGFSTQSFIGARAENFDQNLNLFMDINGDGATDHIRITSGSIQKIYSRADTYSSPDKITKFTNGLGAINQVLYRPLTFSSTYTQGNHQTTALNYGLGSPVLDLMGAIYVVRQVEFSSPIEGDEDYKNTIRYRYENAKVQTGGRGFLGFEKIITATPVKSADDSDVKILQTTTTYRQDFPYNGIPVNTEIRQLTDDFYSSQNVPPVCDDTDGCFPPPCEVGTTCEVIPRGVATGILLAETISSVAQNNATNRYKFAYIDNSETKTYDPDTGILLKSAIQTSTHDDYGNPLITTQVIKDGAGTTLQTNIINSTYSNITTDGKWLIGLLETSTTSRTRTGKPNVTTELEYDYNETTGLLLEERINPNAGSDLFLRIKYEYDNYGNETKVMSCSSDLTTSQCSSLTPSGSDATNPDKVHRYNRLTFDAKGRYIDETYNTLEQKISDVTAYDIYGNPLTTVDILGRTTTNIYDTFGRLTSSRNTLGEWSQTSRQWCAGLAGDLACPANKNIKVRVRQTAAGGSTFYSYLDIQGKEVATISKTFNLDDDAVTTGNEQWSISQIWLDQFGRQVKTQGPYFLGSNDIPETTTEFDRYSRPTKVTLSDSSTQQMSYFGFVTTTTNGLGQRKQETKNALGQIIEISDFDQSGTNPNYQNTLSYTHNSQGLITHIRRTTDSTTELLSINTYDLAGRKISINSVDSGLITTIFNAESEFVETEDAKGQVLKNYYDTLGRVYKTQSWDNNVLLTTTKKGFDATTGLVELEEKYLGNDTLPDYIMTNQYDTYKRASSTTISFDDSNNVCTGASCNYSVGVYYDQYSRIKYQQDASTKAIENHYTTAGYLNRITDADDANKEYYQLIKTDKWGNISTDKKAGNNNLITTYGYDINRGWLNSINSTHQDYSYNFDILGNLVKRTDTSNNQSECFKYDRLNRLTDTYHFNNSNQNCNITTGNTEHKTTAYDGSGNITLKDGQIYSYLNANNNTIGSSPHQVQSKGLQNFTYDNNGNLSQSTNFINSNGSSVTRNIEYTAFDKISRIYTGSILIPDEESLYRYNTSEKRFSRKDTNSDGQTSVTHFIGNVEVEYNHNGQVAYKRQLGNYAIITETNNSTQETYLFTDHLGSVDTITDKNGNLLQSMSFSAWGERRLPSNWENISIPSARLYLSDYTTRGFTGHEMLDAFGIINMGGRIYDAALGKVLQADPFVQDPANSQSFNRYSYVFNNPLSYTDPSGFISLRQIIGIVAAMVVGYFLGPFATTLWKAFWVGFATGFTSAIIITGNFRSALKAGLIAGAIAGIGFATSNNPATSTESGAPGGVNDNISSNGFESANISSNNVPSATSSTLEQTANQASGLSAPSVAVEIDAITVIGQAVDGFLLADFAAQYWYDVAIAAGSVAFLSDTADLLEFDAETFPDGSITQNSFNQTAFEIRDVARQAQSAIRSDAAVKALLSGAIIAVATSFIPIGRAVGWAKGAVQSKFKRFLMKRQMQKVAASGKIGEAAVRSVYNIGDKQRFAIGKSYRIPDGATKTTLSEIKNYAGKLSYTKQLRDFSAIARSEGLIFNLYVRSNTTLTGPLLKAIADKNIILKFIPGT
ncbi:hypothetical protein MNBD_GAMMA01-703, partial [hydrothermal vent metagenome]